MRMREQNKTNKNHELMSKGTESDTGQKAQHKQRSWGRSCKAEHIQRLWASSYRGKAVSVPTLEGILSHVLPPFSPVYL